MSLSRHIAATALVKVTEDKAYSNLVLNSIIGEQKDMGADDKALSTAIFYGTLDRMVTIDFYLKKLIKTPLKKLKPYTLAVLRTAIFQIKYLDKIPNSAAVNEAVKLIKASKESHNASFVNAVLRNFLRTDIPLPNGNSIFDISVAFSCPQWIVSQLIKDYSVDFTKSFLENALLPPPLFVRVNTLKTEKDKLKEILSKEGIEAKDGHTDTMLLLDINGSVEKTKAYNDGLFFVQDSSCQQALEMLDIKQNSRVLDVCAAPGGKSFAAAMKAVKGEIISCELYEHRTGLIESGAKRLGITNLTAKTADATVYDKELGLFDRIVCDVPCSGLGVIRRKPDIKYKAQTDMAELIDIQQKILCNASKYLQSGGNLLYSTCTLSVAENRGNVDNFLQSHPDFILINEYTFSPRQQNTDGFYAAVISKK